MVAKLREHMNDSRIPLGIRRKDDWVYFQLQITVARDDGLNAGYYCEYSKVNFSEGYEMIGKKAIEMLAYFQKTSDMSLNDFENYFGIDFYEYSEEYKEKTRKEFFKETLSESGTDLLTGFDECFIKYCCKNSLYEFGIFWSYKEGKRYYSDSSDSTGKDGVLVFDKLPEFGDNISLQALGEMIIEALDRSRKLADKMSLDICPKKDIELLNGQILSIYPPKDRHIVDFLDASAAEIYQIYSYVKSWDKEPYADFFFSIAPEIYHSLSIESIKNGWYEAYNCEDEIFVSVCELGIFSFKAEFKTSKLYKQSYFRKLDEDCILECSVEIKNPNQKKKVFDKLIDLFNGFAFNCKIE